MVDYVLNVFLARPPLYDLRIWKQLVSFFIPEAIKCFEAAWFSPVNTKLLFYLGEPHLYPPCLGWFEKNLTRILKVRDQMVKWLKPWIPIIPESQGKPRLFLFLITLDARGDQSPSRDLGQHFNKRDRTKTRLIVKLLRADNSSESYSRQETHYSKCFSPLPVEVDFHSYSFKSEPFRNVPHHVA